jgi:anti-sigma factor RsiW
MNAYSCTEIRDRLVPFCDGELGPSESHVIEEHLGGCAACRDHLDRLDAVTPEPALVIPAPLIDELDRRIRLALDEAERAPRLVVRTPTPTARVGRWLGRPTGVSYGAALAYAAVLTLAVSWGMTNWWTARDLEARLAANPVTLHPGDPLPAAQFREASSVRDNDDGTFR